MYNNIKLGYILYIYWAIKFPQVIDLLTWAISFLNSTPNFSGISLKLKWKAQYDLAIRFRGTISWYDLILYIGVLCIGVCTIPTCLICLRDKKWPELMADETWCLSYVSAFISSFSMSVHYHFDEVLSATRPKLQSWSHTNISLLLFWWILHYFWNNVPRC